VYYDIGSINRHNWQWSWLSIHGFGHDIFGRFQRDDEGKRLDTHITNTARHGRETFHDIRNPCPMLACSALSFWLSASEHAIKCALGKFPVP
jgi:hypothetical protein